MSAWSIFLEENPDQEDSGNVTLDTTDELMSQLRQINKRVNAFGYENDKANKWGILDEGEDGDCQHLVTTKRKLLNNLGVPLEALKPATCELPVYVAGGGYHAILIVTTEPEWIVLDNICPFVVTISKLYNYRFIMMLDHGKIWKYVPKCNKLII